MDKLIPVLFQNGFDPQNVENRRLKVLSHANEVCKRPSLVKKEQRTVRYKVVNLLKENHIRLFSPKKMEQVKKKRELLSLIREYRFVREEELVFHIRKSMKEVQSSCQKVELSEKIKVLLSELPLTVKERHRRLNYTKSVLPLWMEVLQCSIDLSIVVGGFLLVSHLMKRR